MVHSARPLRRPPIRRRTVLRPLPAGGTTTPCAATTVRSAAALLRGGTTTPGGSRSGRRLPGTGAIPLPNARLEARGRHPTAARCLPLLLPLPREGTSRGLIRATALPPPPVLPRVTARMVPRQTVILRCPDQRPLTLLPLLRRPSRRLPVALLLRRGSAPWPAPPGAQLRFRALLLAQQQLPMPQLPGSGRGTRRPWPLRPQERRDRLRDRTPPQLPQ